MCIVGDIALFTGSGKYIYLLAFNRVHGNNITQVGLRPGEIQLVQPVPTTVDVH